jgi:hypothetical protein
MLISLIKSNPADLNKNVLIMWDVSFELFHLALSISLFYLDRRRGGEEERRRGGEEERRRGGEEERRRGGEIERQSKRKSEERDRERDRDRETEKEKEWRERERERERREGKLKFIKKIIELICP